MILLTRIFGMDTTVGILIYTDKGHARLFDSHKTAHDGASFFVYHRWFLNLYQAALRQECGYDGNMM